ncbi:MAG: hypothetical protein IT565_11845 [Rhodospirillales bacterium]|nr:hypothetical protein [Rhodospirillales bacterium]
MGPRLIASLILAAFVLASAPAWAQAKAKGKNQARGCFTKPEQAAEQQVRQGVRLREFAWRCEETPYLAKTLELWTGIDKKFGKDFAKVTETRQKAFQREFPESWKTDLEVWNGRIVLHYRHLYLSKRACVEARNQLEQIDKKGFKTFQAIAAKAKPDVIMDYKICP